MTGPDGEQLDADLRVVATGIGRVIDLDTDVLPILPTGEYYQVWFVGPGDSPDTPDRISAGTFHPDPDGRSEVHFAAAVNLSCTRSWRSRPSPATATLSRPAGSCSAPRSGVAPAAGYGRRPVGRDRVA